MRFGWADAWAGLGRGWASFQRRWADLKVAGLGRRGLGLDLRAESLLWVDLAQGRDGQTRLTGWGRLDFPEAVSEGSAAPSDAVVRSLQSWVQSAALEGRTVAMGLPSAHVLLRRTRFRSGMGGLGAEELAAYVEGEAAAWAPFAMEDLALDFAVLGPTAAGMQAASGVPVAAVGPAHAAALAASTASTASTAFADEVEVLMAAARQDRVRARQALAQAAGLKLQVLDIESNAALLALRAWRPPDGQLGTGEALGLVDAQRAALNLRVMAQGEIVFERSEAVGPGVSGPWWLQTLSRLLQLFHAAHAGRRLVGLALVGDHAGVPDRVEWPHSIARLAGVPAWWMDPFVHLGCAEGSRPAASPPLVRGPGARPAPDQACAYALACGLALRALAP